MTTGTRVEWLQTVAALLDEQRTAMLTWDVDHYLVLAQRLEDCFRQPPQWLDPPPSPQEQALLRTIGRLTREQRTRLGELVDPLRELDDLARQTDHAVALDCRV